MKSVSITRKQFLLGAGAACAVGLSAPRAYARRPRIIKFGFPDRDDPTTVNAALAGQRIEEETKGRFKLQVFPSSELGDDDHMISGARTGAIEMAALNDSVIASLVPAAAIDSVGFAFKDSATAWQALDGKVGEIVCKEISKHGLYPMRRIWDEGFREITTSTKPINSPADLKGFKIRVPPSPIMVSLFDHLGASATALNVAALYSALQTKVVDGQENPLGVIETQRFYEVQKYCSLTSHVWSGYWVLAGAPFWESISPEDRNIIETAFNDLAPKQRAETKHLNDSMQAKLMQQGLIFNTPERAPFREALKSSGYYAAWKQKLGTELWAALEQYTGQLD